MQCPGENSPLSALPLPKKAVAEKSSRLRDGFPDGAKATGVGTRLRCVVGDGIGGGSGSGSGGGSLPPGGGGSGSGGGGSGGSGDEPSGCDGGANGPTDQLCGGEDVPVGLPPSSSDLDAMPTPLLPSIKPSGITQDAWDDIQQQWNNLNSTEKKLCLFSPVHCGVAAGEGFLAIDFADQLYPTDQRRNGPNDALKHARWAAGMTRSMNAIHTSTGVSWAAAWLAAHENVPNNPQPEYDMDMHNNTVGIGIGQSAILDVSQKVEDAWRNGELQEWACPDHPTDRRFGCIPPELR